MPGPEDQEMFARRIILSPEDARALRKAAGLPEEPPVEAAPERPPREQTPAEAPVTHFEEDANPTRFIDARNIRERIAEEDARLAAEKEKRKQELLGSIRDNLDELMPDDKS